MWRAEKGASMRHLADRLAKAERAAAGNDVGSRLDKLARRADSARQEDCARTRQDAKGGLVTESSEAYASPGSKGAQDIRAWVRSTAMPAPAPDAAKGSQRAYAQYPTRDGTLGRSAGSGDAVWAGEPVRRTDISPDAARAHARVRSDAISPSTPSRGSLAGRPRGFSAARQRWAGLPNHNRGRSASAPRLRDARGADTRRCV